MQQQHLSHLLLQHRQRLLELQCKAAGCGAQWLLAVLKPSSEHSLSCRAADSTLSGLWACPESWSSITAGLHMARVQGFRTCNAVAAAGRPSQAQPWQEVQAGHQACACRAGAGGAGPAARITHLGCKASGILQVYVQQDVLRREIAAETAACQRQLPGFLAGLELLWLTTWLQLRR